MTARRASYPASRAFAWACLVLVLDVVAVFLAAHTRDGEAAVVSWSPRCSCCSCS